MKKCVPLLFFDGEQEDEDEEGYEIRDESDDEEGEDEGDKREKAEGKLEEATGSLVPKSSSSVGRPLPPKPARTETSKSYRPMSSTVSGFNPRYLKSIPTRRIDADEWVNVPVPGCGDVGKECRARNATSQAGWVPQAVTQEIHIRVPKKHADSSDDLAPFTSCVHGSQGQLGANQVVPRRIRHRRATISLCTCRCW
ncbi:hypothetical protein BDN67DRAFT_748380 [Paxillus ammoniavirescens]|nr:hypothetical protein BDN67DRAFT_748380 [Paxillus ammoniavirescens]